MNATCCSHRCRGPTHRGSMAHTGDPRQSFSVANVRMAAAKAHMKSSGYAA